MKFITKLKGLFRKEEVKPAPHKESLVEHFKNLSKCKSVLDAIRKPIDRGEAMRNVFQRTIMDIESTVCEVKNGRSSFTTGGKVWAFDEATQTIVKKKSDDSVSSIDRFKAFTNFSTDIPDEVYQFYARGFITWTTCAQFAQHEIINRACAVRGEDAVAVGFELSYADDDDKHADANGDGRVDKSEKKKSKETKNDFLTALMKKTNRMGIKEVLRKLDYNKCVYGVGIAVPCFSEEVDMSLPFNIDAKGLETYEGFAIIEPYWLCPMFNDKDSSDPSSRNFFEPTWWRLPNGKMIHRSWCIKAVNSYVADILKPTYYYGGIPLTQMIYERVFAADKCANEAPMLALTKRLLVVDANIQQILADPKHVKDLMDVVTYCRTNWGVMFKQPTAAINQIDTSLGEYDQLIMTQYQLVASIAQMPATKLLKVTPTGFQSTGEYEWKDWAQSLIDIQDMEFTPLLERHFQLLSKKAGRLVAVNIKWNAVDAPTAREKADIEAVKASTYSQLLAAGAVTVDEVRDVMRNDRDSDFTGLSMESPKKDSDLMEQLIKEMGGKTGNDSVETMDDAEFERKHQRDKDGQFVRGAGVGVKHSLTEYAKEKGKPKWDAKGNHVYAEKDEAKKAKAFAFPKVSQSEKHDARKLSTVLANHYNGGNREPNLKEWKANARAVKYCGKTQMSELKPSERYERSAKPKYGFEIEKKTVMRNGRKVKHEIKRVVVKKGKPMYDWILHGQKLSDKEAYALESALANGGYGVAVSPASKNVVVRKDFANGRGHIMRYTPMGTTKVTNVMEHKSSRFLKDQRIKQVNSVFTNADKIFDRITKDFNSEENDFGVLAYFQYRTTCRIGSSNSNDNAGARQIRKKDVKVNDDKITIDFDAKNGRWHTELTDHNLARWFKFNSDHMKDNEAFFDTVDYNEYNDYLRKLGNDIGIPYIKKTNNGKTYEEGFSSHDMRRLSATLYAARLVDEIKINPRKDREGYISAIEGVIQKTANHINDKDASMAFKSYIAPAALWKNAMFIYESDDRFTPPTGR